MELLFLFLHCSGLSKGKIIRGPSAAEGGLSGPGPDTSAGARALLRGVLQAGAGFPRAGQIPG